MIQKETIKIYGMTCASCSSRIEKKLNSLKSVKANVNLATEKAVLEFDSLDINRKIILQTIENIGYKGELEKSASDETIIKKKEIIRLKRTFIISAVLSFPLLVNMVFMFFNLKIWFIHDPLYQLLLAIPVQFIIGFRFYKNAFHQIKSFSPGMDVLIAIGTSSAFFFSIYSGFINNPDMSNHIYFEASSIIITLVLLGKFFEANAKGKTGDAIKKLIGLKPKKAVILKDGIEKEIDIDDVAVNDVLIVRPGGKIPADGIIISGFSSIDESMITGESIPVDKKEGDEVIGSSINKFGSINLRVTKIGNDTFLSQIISIVENAQGAKAKIQKLADKTAGIFVPVVLTISVITFLLWILITGNINQAIISSVAVLVIACPCALGLATPTAIMVGTGIGAEKGILIKNGDSLETAGKLTTIVLDKTGTITTGKPELTDIVSVSSYSEDELLMFAGVAEKKSEHPIGKTIYQFALNKHKIVNDPDSFESIPGKGIVIKFDNKSILIGTKPLLLASGLKEFDIPEKALLLLQQGKTVVYISIDNVIAGFMALSDTIKASSVKAISDFKNIGLEVIMLTGDNKLSAEYFCKIAGIDKAFAEVLPEDKANVISELKKQGKIVAMIGDGINDAPALVTADTGFAIGTGTDIAIESGDITLISGDLTKVVTAIKLSKKTIRKIKQNLFWAFFYNIIGIPFAAFGFLNPIIAGSAMAFSSFSVIMNSLSLKNFKE